MLSDADTRAIQHVKTLLGVLQGMAVRQAVTAESSNEAFSWGKFSEACHVAADCLGQVLIVADTYLDDVHAAAAERGQR
jgi:hypothetical protein